MTGRDAVNLVLGGRRSPAQIFRSVTEGDKASPGGKKPFPGAKSPFSPDGSPAEEGETQGYKPGPRGDEGMPGDDAPASGQGDDESPSPKEEGENPFAKKDDEDEDSPSPKDEGEESPDGSPSPSSPDGDDGETMESARAFLARCEEEYGIAGGDHDPDTQEPATPDHLDTDDDSPGE